VIIITVLTTSLGSTSIASIATCYRLDSLEMESAWRRDFHTCQDGPLGPLYNGYWVAFPGVKWPGHDPDHPLPSSTEVKERVKTLLLWAFMACSRVNFTFA
jgi:hypothetical protein